MKSCAFVLAVTLGFLVSGCGKSGNENIGNSQTAAPSPKATATPDQFANTRVIYAKDCVECHGAEGHGGAVTVDKVKLKVPSLTEGHALKHRDEDFVDQIENGGDGMPKFKDKLSATEIDDLVRFVRHEFQGK
jgi:mono/diheme cytochrome c family protein